MLVLSRRVEEEIVIDGQIRIKVLENSRGKVRLGISAPDDVRIERSELLPLRTIECLSPPRRSTDRLDVEIRRSPETSSVAVETPPTELRV